MSAIFPLSVWQPGTLQPSTPFNDNALRVEILQRGAISILSTPPGSPADGDVYVLGSSPTGAWSTFAQNDVVLWRSGTWYRFAPFTGWLKQVGSDVRRFSGTAWEVLTGSGGGAVPVQDEGTTVVPAPTAINFTGAGVSTTNVGGVATVNIPGGGGGSSLDMNNFTFAGNPNAIIFTSATARRVLVEIPLSQSMRFLQPRNSGKWYMEWLINAMGTGSGPTFGAGQSNMALGSSQVGDNSSTGSTARSATWGLIANSGSKYHGGVDSYGSSSTTDDVIMMAVDIGAGRIWWGKNGTWFASGDPAAGTNAAYTNLVSYVVPAMSLTTGAEATARITSGEFSHSIPSGFSAWAS